MVEALASRGMGVPPMKHGQDARVTSGFPSRSVGGVYAVTVTGDQRPATCGWSSPPKNLCVSAPLR